MENVIYLIIVAIVICGIAVSIWNNRPEETKGEDAAASEGGSPRKTAPPMTCDLLQETLRKIGCQYEIDDENEEWKRIAFSFQGERFIADAANDSVYVHLWDAFWKRVDLEDLDEVARLRRCVNTVNVSNSVTTVYTIEEDESKMSLHCKATVPFLSQIPYHDDYLKAVLVGFFRTHRDVDTELMRLKDKETGGNV